MSTRLRELIRQVRACQTAADERTVITKECALIRTDFKEGKEQRRGRNIMKLMYIHMLGYSTEFGQVECVKLLAQPEYAYKRVGYLTLGILLDETGEVLTLIQNHLKKDLSNGNQFIQALALATIANICSEDMARDVCQEVAGLVDSPNSYVRKKAILAGLRVVRKVPEFIEHFAERIALAMTDRNHGVMISALNFAAETIPWPSSKPFHETYIRTIPAMTKVLKALLMSSYAAENDVNGVADPFVQVKMLRIMGFLAETSPTVSQSINDILAQVATNTDNSKNAGSAILYECAMVIVSTDCDSGLRPLGVNILGRFLTNKDNNYRYVALNSMLKMVVRDPESVQKHRTTIVECLKDADPSIRKRALDLVVGLVQPANIKVLVPDLTVYLSVCTVDFRDDLADKLCAVIMRHSPSDDFQTESLLRIITTAGSHVTEGVTHQFIALVSQVDKSVRQATVESLWQELLPALDVHALSNRALMTAAAWLIGEYSDELAELHISSDPQFYDTVVAKLAEMANLSKTSAVKEYCLSAMMKLASRNASCRFLATSAMEPYCSNSELEVQQRSCEYVGLLRSYEGIAAKTMAKMPPLQHTVPHIAIASNASAPTMTAATTTPSGVSAPVAKNDVLDDIFGSVLTSAPTQQHHMPDFGLPPTTQMHHNSPPAVRVAPSPPPVVAAAVYQPQRTLVAGFRNDDVVIEFDAWRGRGTCVEADAVIRPLSAAMSEITFLVAVPKSATIELMPMSGVAAGPGQRVTQRMVVDTNVTGDGEVRALTLKVKIGFSMGGQEHNHVFQVKQMIA